MINFNTVCLDFTPMEAVDVRLFQSELNKYKGYTLEANGIGDYVSVRGSFDEAYFDHYGERYLSLKSGGNVATLSFVKRVIKGTVPDTNHNADCYTAYKIVCEGSFTQMEREYYLICN